MGLLFINATGKQKEEEEDENDENNSRSKICEVEATLLSVMIPVIGCGLVAIGY
jgi:hypothetical protein